MSTIFGGLLGGVLAHRQGVGTALVIIGGLQLVTALVLFISTIRIGQGGEEDSRPGGAIAAA